MQRLLPLTLILLFPLILSSQSQSTGSVFFKQGGFQPPPLEQLTDLPAPDSKEEVQGYYFRWVQFVNIPNAAQRRQLEKAGWQILEYVHQRSYLCAIPYQYNWSGFPWPEAVSAVFPPQPEWKIDPRLLERPLGKWAMEKGEILVSLLYMDVLDAASAIEKVRSQGLPVKHSFAYGQFIKTRIPASRLEEIAALPWVKYLEIEPEPDQPDDDRGRALHKANLLDAASPTGRKYDGRGIKILVRDDGTIDPHIDLEGRLIELANDFGFTGTHGEGVIGIAGGAGNLNPAYRGMATGATLYNLNYQSQFTDTTLDLHLNDTVVLTNSSYSNGCNDGYTFSAFNVDKQVYENPSLMHIFSGGNSNGNDCGYGAGDQWGNITGGHKIGKNVIATANVNYLGQLRASSSRGPAHDGRLKPDITANGHQQISLEPDNEYSPFGGTSAAAPGIMGIMAQLYQAYRDHHGGAYPPSALIKALLLNNATDYGNPGPDFQFGWGIVNAYKAVLALENEQYTSDALDQSDQIAYNFSIPAGLAEARFMLYWPDPPASTLTDKALINDLELRVVAPSGDTLMPLILDHRPEPDLLDKDAVPGRDSINNMEQVLIELPESGTYTVLVSGRTVPMGPQEFFLTHSFFDDAITVTYPNGAEALTPLDTREVVHWDAFGNDGVFLVEYSLDNGANWEEIGSVPGDIRLIDFTVPDEVTAEALVRVSRGGQSDVSDEPFSIAAPPFSVQMARVCPDSMRIEWIARDYANAHEFFVLGDQYMDSIGTTPESYFEVPISFPVEEPIWVAVNTLADNGAYSKRTIAVELQPEDLVNCPLKRDLTLTDLPQFSETQTTRCSPFEEALQWEIRNNGSDPVFDFQVSYQINGGTLQTATVVDTIPPGQTLLFTFPNIETLDGNTAYSITGWTQLPTDEFSFNDTLRKEVSFFVYDSIYPAVYTEDFENVNFPDLPEDWVLINPDDMDSWQYAFVTGQDGAPTTCKTINHYNYNQQGELDYLLTPPVDLANLDNPALLFDYAYTFYDFEEYFDSLRIELSTDCGATFPHVLFFKGKESLATRPPSTGAFSPTPQDWRNEFIDLQNFAGETVIIRFVGVNGYGNNVYLDNINVNELPSPTAAFEFSQAEACEGQLVTIQNQSQYGGQGQFTWNFPPELQVIAGTEQDPNFQVAFSEEGSYVLELITSNTVGSDTFENIIEIAPLPTAAFTGSTSGGTVTFDNQSEAGEEYLWLFGDGNSSTDESPSHTYSSTGEFEVQLIVSNNCGSDTSIQTFQVTISSVEDISPSLSLQISPNPGTGRFLLQLEGERPSVSETDFSLYNLAGQRMGIRVQRDPTLQGQQRFVIDARSLPVGSYVLQVQHARGVLVERLVIAR